MDITDQTQLGSPARQTRREIIKIDDPIRKLELQLEQYLMREKQLQLQNYKLYKEVWELERKW